MKKAIYTGSLLLNLIVIVSVLGVWTIYGGWFLNAFDGGRETRVGQFEAVDVPAGSIVFVGDSITHAGLWSEWFPDLNVINRGIGGDTTQDVLDRVEHLYRLKPGKLFLMIGINDLNLGKGHETAIANYRKLFDGFDENIPDTRIYLQSVLPVDDLWGLLSNEHVPALNQVLREEAKKRGYTYIDLYPAFLGEEGGLRDDVTADGIHLLADGYQLWRDAVLPYVQEFP